VTSQVADMRTPIRSTDQPDVVEITTRRRRRRHFLAATDGIAAVEFALLLPLLLLVLLLLLLRNILKLYADQSSSALGSRLRTRMVLGAALIALTPAVFMFLFSFQLMNRSIDRWSGSSTGS